MSPITKYEEATVQLSAWRIRNSVTTRCHRDPYFTDGKPELRQGLKVHNTYSLLQDSNPGLSASTDCPVVNVAASTAFFSKASPSSPPLSQPPGIQERDAVSFALPSGVRWAGRKAPSYPLVAFFPSCVHFACEAADCPELAVENASLNCSSSDRYHGARCTVSCRTGYVLQIQRDDELIKSQVCTGAGLRAPLRSPGVGGGGRLADRLLSISQGAATQQMLNKYVLIECIHP